MLARSNVVLAGYWENPEETERCLEGGWFHTGDGGVIGDDGYLTIQDRKKDVIITGGENVSSIEVEDAIFSHPDVAEVAVIGVPDEKWGETIKALVVKAEGSPLTEQELIDYVKGKVARYKAPSSVEFREALDRTATGKLQKFKLRAPYWEGRDRQVELTSLRARGRMNSAPASYGGRHRRRPVPARLRCRHRRRRVRGRCRRTRSPRPSSPGSRWPRSRRRPEHRSAPSGSARSW